MRCTKSLLVAMMNGPVDRKRIVFVEGFSLIVGVKRAPLELDLSARSNPSVMCRSQSAGIDTDCQRRRLPSFDKAHRVPESVVQRMQGLQEVVWVI
jgi:hypothetical protein